jgi:hypothetical protein
MWPWLLDIVHLDKMEDLGTRKTVRTRIIRVLIVQRHWFMREEKEAVATENT